MPSNDQLDFPIPRDWQEFQRMTCDLFRKLWRDPHAQEFGTLGARQDGVDVYGITAKEKCLEGVQCKRTTRLTADQVKREYEESKSFRPKLGRFIIATTAKRNVAAQRAATELTLAEEYPCSLMFWEDFSARLGQYSKLVRKHYPQFVVVQMLGDAPGKIVRLDVETDHFEMMLTAVKAKEDYYGGTILVSDLLSNRCITYRLGDHYSRLESIVGNRWRAYVVSTWLNRFKKAEDLMRLGRKVLSFEMSAKDRKKGRALGLTL